MSKMKQVMIAGFGGQGVMLLGQMFAQMANETGQNSLWYPSYGPETRGGTANCSVTMSTRPINSPVFSKANTVIALNKPSLEKFLNRVCDGGEILYNSSLAPDEVKLDNARVYPIPVNDMAMELGNIRVANMIMLGAYLELNQDFDNEVVKKVLVETLGERRKDLIEINVKAIETGKNFIKEFNK